ncbi:MAG: Maf family protein [Gammaproteobacteria bacterium]|nr:Maf family protein [Gammaproteobacteria bacterium]
MTSDKPIILASASPRRAELLRQIRLPFEVVIPEVDESRRQGEIPRDYVRRLAQSKAAAVRRPERLTLGADTTVVLDGAVLGKPRDASEGVAMLTALGGRAHTVLTAVCLGRGGAYESRVVATEVRFRPISEALAAAYWRTGEGGDKAGGYGIQGIGSIFATRIEGSYSAVVGLPLAETEELLNAFGFDPWGARLG